MHRVQKQPKLTAHAGSSAIRLVAYYIETGVLRVKRLFTRREAYYHILTELYGGPQYYWVFTKLLLTDGYASAQRERVGVRGCM